MKNIFIAIACAILFSASIYIGFNFFNAKTDDFQILFCSSIVGVIVGLSIRYFTYIISVLTSADTNNRNLLLRLNKLSLFISILIFIIGGGLSLGLYLKSQHLHSVYFSLLCIGLAGMIGASAPVKIIEEQF